MRQDRKVFEMKKLRVAQIGVLHEHSNGIMKTLRYQMSDIFDVVAIAPEEEDNMTNRHFPCYEGLNWVTMDEIFELPDLDAVFVETEMRQLVPVARRCLEHGLPIHIDKPGGENLEDYARLVQDFYDAGLLFQPGYMLRHSWGVNFMLNAVRKGWIGEVWEVDANMHRDEGSADFRNWFAEYHGGTMFNYASHLIDVLLELMGEPQGIHPYFRNTAGDKVNDTWVTLFTYPKAIATIHCSMCGIQGIPHRRFTIRGTKGTLELFPLEQGYQQPIGHPKFNDIPVNVHMVLAEDNEEYKAGVYDLKIGPMNDRFEDQLREFADLLCSGRQNPKSAEYEITLQKMILAASDYIKW